jgi:hypothetical protein
MEETSRKTRVEMGGYWRGGSESMIGAARHNIENTIGCCEHGNEHPCPITGEFLYHLKDCAALTQPEVQKTR